MTELEKRILSEARARMPEIEKNILSGNYETRYIKTPLIIDNVIDFIIYDTLEKRFTEIEYTVGKGDSFSFGNKQAGFYDEVEHRTIQLPST
jgi:hypothetical protein